MRTLVIAFASSLAACGGGGRLPDFAAGAPICPTDISTVHDGDPCGADDVGCGACTPTCTQACVELFCEDGAWIHVQENAFCDLGAGDADGG